MGPDPTAVIAEELRRRLRHLGGAGRVVRWCVDAVEAAGGTLYVVGGTVRDAALAAIRGVRRPRGDVDLLVCGLDEGAFATLARRLEADRPHERWHVHGEVGRAFPVVKIRGDGVEIDLAPARRRGALASRATATPPALLDEDLDRRDFTIDALAWRLGGEGPDASRLVDRHGALGDLAGGRLRCVGDPARTLADDPLRLFRAVRLEAELDGLAMTPGTAEAVRAGVLEHAATLPAERVTPELERALRAAPARTAARLVELGFPAATAVMPEVGGASGWATAARRLAAQGDALPGIPRSALWGIVVASGPRGPRDEVRRLRLPRRAARVAEALRAAVGLCGPYPAASFEAHVLRRLADDEIDPVRRALSVEGAPAGATWAELWSIVGRRAEAVIDDATRDRWLARLAGREGRARGELVAALRDGELRGEVTDPDGAWRRLADAAVARQLREVTGALAAAAGDLRAVRARHGRAMLRLAGRWPGRWFAALRAADRLGELWPELAALDGVPQPPEFHAEGDVLVHTRLALEALARHYPDASDALVLAVLLHDAGKPATLTMPATAAERIRFDGHDRVGAAMVRRVGAELGLDAAEVDRAVWLVAHHIGFFFALPAMRPARADRVLGDPRVVDLLRLHHCDALASRRPHGRDDLSSLRRAVLALGDHLARRRDAALRAVRAARLRAAGLDGHGLIERLCLSPGPDVGRVHAAIHRALDANPALDDAALWDIARRAADEVQR